MIESAEEFVNLRSSSNPLEYERAASEQAPTHVWMDVIEHYPDMKIWVIRNKTVPLNILRLLSDDPNSNIRAAIADKRKLDEDLFEKLSQDKDESVRQRIAYNKKTPLKILEKLSSDAEEMVRSVATNRLDR